MKNLLTAFAFLTLCVFFVSCEKLEKLDNVTIQNTWKKSFDITITQEQESIAYDDSYTLNIREEDEDLKPILERLEKFTVHEVNLYIENFIGSEEATFEGAFSFSKEGASEPLLLSSFSKVNLSELYETETPVKLTLNSSQKKALEKALKDEQELIIALEGTLSNTPAAFTLRVVIDAETEFSAIK
jgi:hypothetical protein